MQRLDTEIEEREAQRLGYAPDEYREIVRRAERVRSERGERLTQDQLAESAAELGITEEDLREAERQLKEEKRQQEALAAQKRVQMRLAGIIAACLLAFSLLVGVFTYNGLASRQAAVNEARANLSSVLQRKADLLPQLTQIVREGSAQQEKLAEAASGLRSSNLEEQLKANSQTRDLLSGAKGGGSSELYLSLVSALEGAENRINVARTRYAAAARSYNEAAGGFPGSMVAPITGLPRSVQTFEAGR